MKRRIACISLHASQLPSASDVDSRRESVYVSELAGQLSKLGYEIDIFTCRDSLAQWDVAVYKPGIRIIQVNAGPMEVGWKESVLPCVDEFCARVSEFIIKQNLRYDLVHANFFMSGLVALELKKRFHIPFIITFHSLGHVLMVENVQDRFPVDRIAIEEQIVRKAEAIVAGSPQEKKELIHFYKANSKKIFVIPPGFNPAEFFPVDRREAREALGLNIGEKIILHAGPMDRRGGADNVIKSIALLTAEKLQIRLVVVPLQLTELASTSTGEQQRLENFASDLGVSRQVTFVSQQEQLNCYYSAADLIVSTPTHGSFGSSPLEAMACGVPVIGTDEGSMKFSILDGRTGFLITPQDPEALADRIGLMLNNQALLQQMSKRALQHVNTSFTWKVIAEHVCNLYEYVLLSHLQRSDVSKPVQVKVVNTTIPLRNMYLRRNIEPKYGS